MSQSCNLLFTFSGLLMPLIATLAVYIAWQQWQTNRNKLKFDLFDRRFAIYEAAQRLTGYVLTRGTASSEELFEFLAKIRGAKFLLNEQVEQYLCNELHRKAGLLQSLNSELQALGVGEERSRNIQAQREIKDWFQEQYKTLDHVFALYLQLSH